MESKQEAGGPYPDLKDDFTISSKAKTSRALRGEGSLNSKWATSHMKANAGGTGICCEGNVLPLENDVMSSTGGVTSNITRGDDAYLRQVKDAWDGSKCRGHTPRSLRR